MVEEEKEKTKRLLHKVELNIKTAKKLHDEEVEMRNNLPKQGEKEGATERYFRKSAAFHLAKHKQLIDEEFEKTCKEIWGDKLDDYLKSKAIEADVATQEKLNKRKKRIEELKEQREELRKTARELVAEINKGKQARIAEQNILREFILTNINLSEEKKQELKDKNLTTLMSVFTAMQPTKPSRPQQTQSTTNLNVDQAAIFQDDDYLRGFECFCGREKHAMAKGCESCRKEANKIKSRENISREQAWDVVYSQKAKSTTQGFG